MSYLTGPGPYDDSWPSHGPVPTPGFPPPPARPSTAPAFACAALFLAGALQSFVFALTTWGSDSNPHLLAALIGIVFSGDITGNADFAVSATMTVACATTTFALALFARLTVVRWILAAIGGTVTVYYFFALLYIAANGGGRFIAVPAVAMLLWAAATAVALLPATAKAMR
jgi:hypothetical protein